MRYLPLAVMAAMIIGAPALAQTPPPPNPGDPAAQTEWNRLNAESRRLEQEREQRQLESQQRLRNEAERQDMQRQRKNDLDQLRMEQNQERRMPRR